MSYDDNNIFAKILRGEIPCNKIYEDDYVLSFHDINPQKKVHALVIPKGKYIDLDDFSMNASSEEMVGLLKGINIVAKKLGISTEVGQGYRALANISEHGGQEVPHLHFHLFGGEPVGKWVYTDKTTYEGEWADTKKMVKELKLGLMDTSTKVSLKIVNGVE